MIERLIGRVIVAADQPAHTARLTARVTALTDHPSRQAVRTLPLIDPTDQSRLAAAK
jgi:hypothetical protein